MTQDQKEKLKAVLNELSISGISYTDIADEAFVRMYKIDREAYLKENSELYVGMGHFQTKHVLSIIDKEYLDEYVEFNYSLRSDEDDHSDCVNIPYKMLTMDKQDKLRDFLAVLFPYYNEQQALELNFI